MSDVYFEKIAADQYGAITVERRWDDTIAYLTEDPTKFGTGKSVQVALANLYIHHSIAVVAAYKRAMASDDKFKQVIQAIHDTFPNK